MNENSPRKESSVSGKPEQNKEQLLWVICEAAELPFIRTLDKGWKQAGLLLLCA